MLQKSSWILSTTYLYIQWDKNKAAWCRC